MKSSTLLGCAIAAMLLSSEVAAQGPHARFDPIVLDLDGDGIDLGGQASFGSSTDAVRLRWTKANTDDAFMVVDATSLRAIGYDISDSAGDPVELDLFFFSGTTLTDPQGTARVISDGWQMLKALDNNADGKVGPSDSVWPHLKLFVDKNGDGAMSASELRSLESGGVVGIGPPTSMATVFDAYGNELSLGLFATDGEPDGLAANALLAPIPEPSTCALAALGIGLLAARRCRKRRGR